MTDNIINVTMAIITLWIVYKYSKLSFERKLNKPWWSPILWTMFYIFQVFVESQKGSASLLILFLNIILVCAIIMIDYLGTIRIKLIKTIFLYVMWMLVEYFTEAFFNYVNVPEKRSVLIGSALSKMFMLIMLQLINRRNQKCHRKMPWNYWIMLFTVPIGSIYLSYIIYLLEKSNLEYINNFSLIAFILLMMINIIIFEVYDKLSYSLEIETENKIFEQQLTLIANSAEEKEKVYDDFRRQQHDYINQIIAIKCFFSKNQMEQAMNLLDDMLYICTDNIGTISKSGNDIIDSIINYKHTIAKKEDVDFRLQTFIPEKLPFAQRDICIILGNAIDNAIEAAKNSTFPFVEIFLGIRKEAFIIVMKNSFMGEIKKNNLGKLITSKENKKFHGYGLSSIEKAVEKYQGQVIIETLETDMSKDKEFILTIILDLTKM